MLGRLLATLIGSGVAANSGKSGALGAAAGLVATRIIRRSPMAAFAFGGLWLGSKLYKRNKEKQQAIAARNAKPARVIRPVPQPPTTNATPNQAVAPEVPPL